MAAPGPPRFAGQPPPPPAPQQHQQQQPGAPNGQPPAESQRKALHPSANKSATSRINPAQMPRMKESTLTGKVPVFETRKFDEDRTARAASSLHGANTTNGPMDLQPPPTHVRHSSASIPPPPTSSRFVVRDLGNASPRFMRSTLYQVPQSRDLRRTCEMPFAIVCQPLAPLDEEDTPNLHHTMSSRSTEFGAPLVDYGEEGPVRCQSCKAYMNPFMRWLDGGRRFQCNFCGFLNECPDWYFCNLGQDQCRRDQRDRAELCYGSVEWTVNDKYVVRPPARPAVVFLLDISADAVRQGIPQQVCQSLLAIFASSEGEGEGEGNGSQEGGGVSVAPGKVAVATFSNSIQYITLKPGAAQPSVTVMPDTSDPYAPVSSSLLLDSDLHRREICAVLRFVLTNVVGEGATPHAASPECCTVAAIHSAGKVIRDGGGKVMAFVRGTCDAGEGADVPKGGSLGYIAEEMADAQVAVDLFSFSSKVHEGLRVLPNTTGGSVLAYPPDFGSGGLGGHGGGGGGGGGDGRRLHRDLVRVLTREQGFEALLRVRASAGLEVEMYRGSFMVRTEQDVDLPAVDADKSLVAYIKHKDRLKEGEEVAFQCALLYTTSRGGQRRIRVHTLSLPVTSVMGNVFRGADLEAQMHSIVRGVVLGADRKMLEDPKRVKGAVTDACVSVLYAYRKYCATSSSTGQLILPEALKLMPLATLGFCKRWTATGMQHPSEWQTLAAQLAATGIEGLGREVVPRLVNLATREVVTCSADAMEDEAVLLLLEGDVGYLWLGTTSFQAQEQLFGHADAQRIQALVAGGWTPPGVAGVNRTYFVARGSVAETKLMGKLTEDRTQSGMSYVEFLCHIHRQIQNRFL